MKPMLLNNESYDLKQLNYNDEWYVSKKRDGVRIEITNKGIKGRSLKELLNKKQIEKHYKQLIQKIPEGVMLEGEFYKHGEPINKITPYCNSENKEIPEEYKIYIFGLYDQNLNFEERLEKLKSIITQPTDKYEIVEQIKITSYEQVMKEYNKYLQEGYEGAVLMSGKSKYKQGRVTVRQQIGYKIKPIREDDLLILGVTERMENLNESQKNELGQSYKRNTVDAKKGTGIAATFICKVRELKPTEKETEYGVLTTKVTITGNEETRRKIWQNKEKYIGQYAVVESMDYGIKDKPRHGRLLRIKDKVEK